MDLPKNIEAEAAAIGLAVNHPELIDIFALTPDQFYLVRHQIIYTAILAAKAKSAGGLHAVIDELRRADKLEAVGGIIGLTDLMQMSYIPSTDVDDLALRVRTLATRRSMITTGGKIAAMGYDERYELDGQLSDAQKLLTQVSLGVVRDGGMPLAQALNAWYDKAASPEREGKRIATGYRDVDQATGGFWASDLTIAAARPGVGKSAFALSLADSVADAGHRVFWFSLEMARDQLLNRLVAIRTGLDAYRLRLGQIAKVDLPRVSDAIHQMQGMHLDIDDTPVQTFNQIRSVLHKHRAADPTLALVVIDYLGLVQPGTRYAGQRVNEVSEISRGLKTLARELEWPVLALHQLSRAVEGRASHVPMLSDLRDSGAVEQDADNIWFIYREELYDQNTDKKGVAEIHVAKQRNGPLGVIPLRYDSITTHFKTLTYRTPEGYDEGYGHGDND